MNKHLIVHSWQCMPSSVCISNRWRQFMKTNKQDMDIWNNPRLNRNSDSAHSLIKYMYSYIGWHIGRCCSDQQGELRLKEKPGSNRFPAAGWCVKLLKACSWFSVEPQPPLKHQVTVSPTAFVHICSTSGASAPPRVTVYLQSHGSWYRISCWGGSLIRHFISFVMFAIL